MPVTMDRFRQFLDQPSPPARRPAFMFRQAQGQRKQAEVALAEAEKALERAREALQQAIGYEKALQDVIVHFVELEDSEKNPEPNGVPS